MSRYCATTKGLCVQVTPAFLEGQSNPEQDKYAWSYTVVITNNSYKTIQLTARRWQITDGNGITQIIQGAGVVGEQPILREGDSFTYTSGCPLSTPSGVMQGTYRMLKLDGTVFEAEIPAFSLDSPYENRVVN